MFAKILLASDGSEWALKAARVAAELSQSVGASLSVLHVFSMPMAPAPFGAGSGADLDPGAMSRYVEEVQDSVARRTGRAIEDAGGSYQTILEVGHPAEVIVRVAETDGYDLIVLGSRGLSEIKSFLLGSVSDKVSHHAHCPVLIVK